MVNNAAASGPGFVCGFNKISGTWPPRRPIATSTSAWLEPCGLSYGVSLRIRKRIEEAFGWAKTVAGLRKAHHRGLPKIDWQFTFAMAAYNLVRLPKLLGAVA